MANVGAYLKQLEQARPLFIRANKSAHELMESVGLKYYQTTHFRERFELRAAKPIEAVSDFELAIRIVKTHIQSIIGKRAAIKVKNHLFVFDATSEGQVRAVSFWWTDKPGPEAMKGRGEFQVEYQ